MKPVVLCVSIFCLLAAQASAQNSTDAPNCEKLVALYIELAKRSGETVTEASARAEVLSDNPTDAECAAMLALFPSVE